MNRDFKKMFFASLLAVLLVVSNLIGMKLTNFLDITIGVDFITYPFTFLCTLLIMNLGSKKEAYRSILVAAVIQLLITISYTLAVNLGNQTLMPDSSLYVNELFKVNQLNILTSTLAFMVSHCLLIYIYDNFKHFNKELYGTVIGLLGAMFLNSIIYQVITLKGYEPIFIVNMLLSSVIIDIIMIIIVTIIFFILKDKNIKSVEVKATLKENNKDLSVEEIVKKDNKVSKKENSVKKNETVKNTVKKSNVKKTTSNKKGNTTTKKNTNSKNASKQTVKKVNKK